MLSVIKFSKIAIAALIAAIAFSCECPADNPTKPGNQAPSLADTNFTARENITPDIVIGTLVATDSDGDTNFTYEIISNDNGLFEVGMGSGELSLASGKSLDFDNTNQHRIVARVSDGSDTAMANITIDVIANQAPSLADTNFTVNEDVTPEVVIGTLVATDPEGDSLTYEIISNDDGLFEVGSNSGQLSLASGRNLNFLSNNEHSIVAQVSDGSDAAMANITIDVIANQAPSLADTNFTVNEDITPEVVIGTLVATDPEGDSLTYEIISNDDGLFEVGSNSGQLSLASGRKLNFLSNNEHSIVAQVSDGSDAATANITIEVTDVNVAPIFADTNFTVGDDIDDSHIIGTLRATDVDGNTLTYEIIANDNGLFEVHSNSGELSLASGKELVSSINDQHQITLGASDGSLLSTALVTIKVLNVDVDDDDDGLIEIYNLTLLHNLRHDLAGTSYKTNGSDPGNTNGCAAGGCEGYELTKSLNFDADGDGSTWSNSGGNYTLDGGDEHPLYFDVSDGGWEPIGDLANPFTAIFEGNDYTITGLAINRRAADYVGMFGVISSARIRNLGLVNNLAHGDDNVGGLVGDNGGIIIASYTTGRTVGDVATDHSIITGGLAGTQRTNGIIIASYTIGKTSGVNFVGGLVGENRGIIIASYNTGAINAFASTGGLVGDNKGIIIASYATGAASNVNINVGGLVGIGRANSSITASYATGAVTGVGNVGALVGSSGGTITASYGFGSVSNESMNNGMDGNPPVSNAAELTLANTGTNADGDSIWNDAASNTEGAWQFGSGAPKLFFNNYDGSGSMFGCEGSTNGETYLIPNCGSVIPGQD